MQPTSDEAKRPAPPTPLVQLRRRRPVSIDRMGDRARLRDTFYFGRLGHDDDDVPWLRSGQVGQIVDRVVGSKLDRLESYVLLAEDDADQHRRAATKGIEAPRGKRAK